MFVLDRRGCPLMPTHPARARELLGKGRAVVVRHTPFVIRLKDRSAEASEVAGVAVRIDPGSKGTGLVLTDDKRDWGADGGKAMVRRGLVALQLNHRGGQIRRQLEKRAQLRRRRRLAHLRYRASRFRNRRRPDGWLAPSVRHRVETTVSVVRRLMRFAPVSEIHVERAVFDTQALSAGRALAGVEYQQGPLFGFELREYLLVRWGRACVYCGVKGVPLQIDHLRARSRGGTNRLSNLVLACAPCNSAKGGRPVEEFLVGRPELAARLLARAKAPLRDAAVMNSTRYALCARLGDLGVPVSGWSGGRTSANRARFGLRKSHVLDALCVGESPPGDRIVRRAAAVLVVGCTGRGSYRRTTPDRFGFPRLTRPRRKQVHGYATGDLARATVPRGKHRGRYVGRVSVRSKGTFALTHASGRIDVHHGNLVLIQRGDGYRYDWGPDPADG